MVFSIRRSGFRVEIRLPVFAVNWVMYLKEWGICAVMVSYYKKPLRPNFGNLAGHHFFAYPLLRNDRG